MANLSPLPPDVIKGAFNLFDTDQSGKLDAEGVAMALNSLGIPATVKDMESHFHTMGAHQTITLPEFQVLARNRSVANQDAIEAQIFSQFDVSGCGVLNARELEAVCKDLGQDVDPSLLKDLVTEVERMHGRFDFQAWRSILAVRPTVVVSIMELFLSCTCCCLFACSLQEEATRSRRRGHPLPQPSTHTEPYAIGAPLQFENNTYITHH